MASTHALIGLLGVALLLARVAAALALSGTGKRRLWVALAVFLAAWVPIGGVPVAGYVRGVTGDVSMTTLVLLVVGLAGAVSGRERRVLSVGIAGMAAVLYPMALGLGALDPYRLGFEPHAMLAVLALAAAFAWLRQYHIVLACIVAAVSAHALALLESANLWDYLLDPWISLASIYDLRWLRRNT